MAAHFKGDESNKVTWFKGNAFKDATLRDSLYAVRKGLSWYTVLTSICGIYTSGLGGDTSVKVVVFGITDSHAHELRSDELPAHTAVTASRQRRLLVKNVASGHTRIYINIDCRHLLSLH